MPTESNNNGKGNTPNGGQMAKFRRLLRSSRSRNIALFLFFLFVSYVFWLIQNLNDTIQRDFNIPLRITDVPADVRVISDIPKTVSVSVRDKGTSLLHVAYGGNPRISVKYSDLTSDELNDRMVISEQMLKSRVRELFSSSAQVVTAVPDSISLIVTDRQPVYARVTDNVEVTVDPQCAISGPITVEPDTVAVYFAPHASLPSAALTTEKLVRSNLKDTLRVELRVKNEPNTVVEPSKVMVTIPVEPLISKTRDVPVRLMNVPAGHNVALFPSYVKVSYLLPMSLYNSETGQVSVMADFSRRTNDDIPLSITNIPGYMYAVELLQPSVEYLIEQ